jgi:hypothetical protein
MKEAGYGAGYDMYDSDDFRPDLLKTHRYYTKLLPKSE